MRVQFALGCQSQSPRLAYGKLYAAALAILGTLELRRTKQRSERATARWKRNTGQDENSQMVDFNGEHAMIQFSCWRQRRHGRPAPDQLAIMVKGRSPWHSTEQEAGIGTILIQTDR